MADDELRQFAADLGRAGFRATQGAQRAVKKGALGIKTQMQADAKGSASFGALARWITFDIDMGGLSAEIGPAKGGGGSGSIGWGANIAYFGGANGGGGTVADPRGALDAEVPKFEQALLDAATEGLT